MKNHIMDLPTEHQYKGSAVLLGLLMFEYKISDERMTELSQIAKEKAIEYCPEIKEASHEQVAVV